MTANASEIMPKGLQWLEGDVVSVARRLLGCILEVNIGAEVVRLRIVETEAYHQTDAASHSYKGRTARTDVMFGPAGHLYVYFTYGMHYCMNVVTGPEGEGSAVLIRAAEPLDGWDILRSNRRALPNSQLTNGPAKLCQATGITKALNGHALWDEPVRLVPQSAVPQEHVVQATRVGISQAQDKPWRFYIQENDFVSKR